MRSRWGAIGTLLLGVGLVASACDGGDPSSPTDAAVTTATVAAAEPGAPPTSDTTDRTDPAASTSEASATTPPTTDRGSPTSTAAPSEEGVSVGPVGSTDLDIETEDGRVQIGDAEVPESAAGFPVPDGLEVELASDTGTDAGFSGTAPGTVLELTEFFQSALPEAGYVIVDERRPAGDADPSVVLLTFESADQAGDIAITKAPGGGTSVIVTIADR